MSTPVSVDLWVMHEPAELAPAVSRQLADLLAADEKARWQRFSRLEDRQRFLLTRGLLRNVLALYTGISPAGLQFSVSTYGKPQLSGADGQTVHFNLSHTRGMAVLAVSRDAPVGVDTEWLDREPRMAALAARYFSVNEQAELEALPEAEMQQRFFAIWTCKEAFLKAIGLGLRIPLDSFSVSLAGTIPVISGHDPHMQGREVACRHWLREDGSAVALAVCTGQDQPLEVHWKSWIPRDQPGSGTPQSS
jgi:4'-phosphopantetheinyl transferase